MNRILCWLGWHTWVMQATPDDTAKWIRACPRCRRREGLVWMRIGGEEEWVRITDLPTT